MLRVNIREVARELKISHTTVYRALNHPEKVAPKQRYRIIEMLNSRGYYLKEQHLHHTVLLNVMDPMDQNEYMCKLARRLSIRLARREVETVECAFPADKYHFPRQAEGAEAVIFFSSVDSAGIRLAHEANPEILTIGFFHAPEADIVIQPDDFLGGTLAADYMIRRGFTQRLLTVRQPPNPHGYRQSFGDRLMAFDGRMRERFPECRIDHLLLPMPEINLNFLDLGEYLLNAAPPPQAIFCVGGYAAECCSRILENLGKKIPLLGYDSPIPDSPYHYDRIVFDPEEMLRWCEFFILNRPILSEKQPIRLLIHVRLAYDGKAKKGKGAL